MIYFMFLAPPLPGRWIRYSIMSRKYAVFVMILVRKTLSAKVELNRFSVLSTRDPNYNNDIQLFLKQFEKSGVNGDTN